MGSKTLFVAPIYNYSPILVHSLLLQTVADWELLLIHDGPNSTGLLKSLSQMADQRIRYYESKARHNDWGHSLRALGLETIASERIAGDFIVVTNADNYYAPGFLQLGLAAFEPATVAVMCGMAHNHRDWMPIKSEPVFGRVDCGGVIVRREAALEIGWRSRDYAADWDFVAEVVERFGAGRIKSIENLLFVHN